MTAAVRQFASAKALTSVSRSLAMSASCRAWLATRSPDSIVA
jgi:hypothetical protein